MFNKEEVKEGLKAVAAVVLMLLGFLFVSMVPSMVVALSDLINVIVTVG